MKGTVVKVIAQRGFAFLRDEDGHDRFLHAESFVEPDAFPTIHEGSVVEFDPIGTGDRSLRAVNVRVVTTEAA